jgi:hypothetical protein
MTHATLATLRAMRELLTPEGAWTQGVEARRADGRSVGFNDPIACSWCLAGAKWRVGDLASNRPWLALGLDSVSAWNDAPGRTQADVLALLDAKIKEGEAEHGNA